jgi:hypothetical protein
VRNFHVQQSWNSYTFIPDKITAGLHKGLNTPNRDLPGIRGQNKGLPKSNGLPYIATVVQQ